MRSYRVRCDVLVSERPTYVQADDVLLFRSLAIKVLDAERSRYQELLAHQKETKWFGRFRSADASNVRGISGSLSEEENESLRTMVLSPAILVLAF